MMVPINVTGERMTILSYPFGCSKGSLPFTYLGLPLGLSNPRVVESSYARFQGVSKS